MGVDPHVSRAREKRERYRADTEGERGGVQAEITIAIICQMHIILRMISGLTFPCLPLICFADSAQSNIKNKRDYIIHHYKTEDAQAFALRHLNRINIYLLTVIQRPHV